VSFLLRGVRRLASVPPFDRLTRVTPLVRLSFALRASLVREWARFFRNELRPGAVTATYTLREAGVRVSLRHHTGDIMVLDEIFSQREYEPPGPIQKLLATLPRALGVVDLGANIGLFGAWLLGRFPEARILAIEADPANAAIHRQTIEANGLEERWTLLERFAAPSHGLVRFAAGAHATSHESSHEGTMDVEAVDVFTHLDGADLIKIDIEGAEWAILADPRFADVLARVLVLEYHADGCPEPDARAAAESALTAIGYDVVSGPTKEAFGAGLVWGFRRSPHSSP
jgi:FkbM family methyltransferase